MIDYTTFFVPAVERGDFVAVRKMLSIGASPNTVVHGYDRPRSALWVAAMRQHKNIFQMLLNSGADITLHINDKGDEFPNMLYMVVWDTELTLDLINRGLDPHAECPLGLNLAWWAAYAENITLVKQLEHMGL